MENTRAHPSVTGWDEPNNSRYYCVIVQYTARFNNEKLCAHLHKLNAGKVRRGRGASRAAGLGRARTPSLCAFERCGRKGLRGPAPAGPSRTAVRACRSNKRAARKSAAAKGAGAGRTHSRRRARPPTM